MTAFAHSARFYDVLYGDKSYEVETDFLLTLLRRYAPEAQSVFEIGCGTGRHALRMAEAGLRVAGIDLSTEMVAFAKERAAASPADLHERMTFEQGDIRSASLGRRFQAAVSLFHVISYLVTDADLHAGLRQIREHLQLGGIFVFDFWHGAAVITEGPQRREKTVESDGWHIHRRTEPVWERDRDVVRVNFHFTATEARSGTVEEFHEEHAMRYFYPDALAAVLAGHGFAEVERGVWPTGSPVRNDAFGVYMVVRAV